jgi:hypothetical protein
VNEKVKILFFCMVFVVSGTFAQNNKAKLVMDNHFYTVASAYKNNKAATKKAYQSITDYQKQQPSFTTPKGNYINTTATYPLISANYYAQNLGFFCKKELQLEKITKVPFKFRLGSVQQCDRMEGKNGTSLLSY